MMKRIEFTLNLDDPTDAALYEALEGLLRHRRAGAAIRQALVAFLLDEHQPRRKRSQIGKETTLAATTNQTDDATTARILDQSAIMFGFQ